MKAARTECTVCGEIFAGTPTFDRHRVGSFPRKTRRCLSQQEIQAIGGVKDERGWWTIPPQKVTATG
jgi:hypothetical protein